FDRLRTVGAFLVSARMVNRQITDLIIESTAGGECRLRHPDPGRTLKVVQIRGGDRAISLRWDGDVVSFNTTPGGLYRVDTGEKEPSRTPKIERSLEHGPRKWTDAHGMTVWLGRPSTE